MEMSAATPHSKSHLSVNDPVAVLCGYKRTEVGVIPEEWDVTILAEIATITTGNTPPTHDATNYGDEYPFVTPVDLGEAKYVVKTEKSLSKKGFSISQRFPADSILFVSIGSTIGKCGIAPVELTSNQQINAVLPSPSFSIDYLYYTICSVAPRIKALAGEQAVPIVNKTQFSETLIPLAPLNEQCAIAEALSDVDGLLAALEALIAKKRAIKQAVMQQLLTGKTRLPGFSGEWKTKRFGDLLTYERPDSYIVQSTEYTKHGDVPVLTANKSFILHYTDEEFGVCSSIPVIVFDDFTTDCKYATFPFKVKSSAIKLLRARHDRVSLRYVYERMKLIRLPVGEHKRYYISEYQNIEFLAPQYDEQVAIVSVLSDMDAEIAALERRRDKTQSIKQGMMQQLLTGRVRLMKPELATTQRATQ